MTLRIGLIVGITALVLHGSVHANYLDRADVRAYLDTLVREHAFDRAALDALFSRTERQQTVLDAIARPAERRLKWHEYRDIFLKEPRIQQGLEFWAENEAALAQAQAQFGVAPEYVVAILGVETRYGRVTGSYRVVDALATLAFDYPPRAEFFRKELTEYLLLTREEAVDPLSLKGSYAGAMGYGQFIPSSFRAYAVDFDGDGQRDIWSSERDAIGSVANYFQRHGWRSDAPVALRVDVDSDTARSLANDSLALNRTVAEFVSAGVQVPGLAADERAALFGMELADGTEYWIGFNNFHVITRYNRSSLYALAVYQLGQAILREREALSAASAVATR